jgi:2-phospho-L-lactate guanylyltransferase
LKAWAVVPVKRFEAAKSRLSGVLDSAARRELARGMFEHVLAVLSAAPDVAGITVVTDSRAVAEVAIVRGAIALFDPPGAEGLESCVDFALGELAQRGTTAALVLMSDLPGVTVGDIEMLARELDRYDVVVVRDASGEHTNALGLRLATRLPTSFGKADSFRRHGDEAARAGLSVSLPESPTLAFDVDTAEDYARMIRES